MIYTEMTIKAVNIAYKAHHGQMDQCGVPYVFHPYHLAEQMEDEICCTVALLHDVVEDTDVTMGEIEEAFPQEVADAVKLLTHDGNTNYIDYIQKIKENPVAKKVKLADLAHNSDETRNVGAVSESKLQHWRQKYAKAKEILSDKT